MKCTIKDSIMGIGSIIYELKNICDKKHIQASLQKLTFSNSLSNSMLC